MFDYYHSEVLDLDYALRRDRTVGTVWFEDGVKYSEREVELLDGVDVAPIHAIKKVFGGEVVGREKRV